MKLLHFFEAESAFDAPLLRFRQNADRIMVGMNVFLTLVCMAIAPYRQTWEVAVLVGVPTLLLSYVLMLKRAGWLWTRVYMACAFMAYTSMIIHQTGGDIEAHFSAFGLIGVLLYYRDWRTIFSATVFIYLQHLVVGYAQAVGWPVFVFDGPEFWGVFALHVAYFLPFVGMMGYLSVWLRREGHEGQRMVQESLAREEQFRQLMVKAEAANRLKGEILANMSHEIRTPLNGVGGMIQLVLNSPVNEAQREMLHTARESSEHLLNVLNHILDFSHIESGALEIEYAPTHVRLIAEEVRRSLAPEAQRKGLQLVVDCVPSVPHVLSTDPVRLRQMLMNLVGNAVKFTHRGGVWVKLQARPTDDPTRVVLELQVKDTGIGFDASVNESLFSPFFQVDGSTTRMYGGTGLGLAITRSLVKCMQGEITASSAPGQGAVFHVSLPCGVLQLMEPLSTDAQAQAAVRAGDALNILLAEDHAINQKVMSMMLSKLGHQVTVAENGRVAMNHLRQKHFDLVLLDAMMPVMDGLQMLAELRAIEAREGGHCPVIMVTAHAMTGDAEKYLGAGADGYLPKPVSMKSLEDEIVRVMGLTRCLM